MESTIEAITTTIETRDPYTTGHQMRVTDLACAIAKVMELPPTQIEGIRVAGLLHDIGKIAIPTEILSKPGKLNEVEFSMIKTHAKVGYNILKKIEFAVAGGQDRAPAPRKVERLRVSTRHPR